MAQPTKSYSFGLHSVFIFRTYGGGAYGQLDPTGTLTGDTTSHAIAYVGDGLVAGLPTVTRRRHQFGGEVKDVTAYSGVEEISEFTIELAPSNVNLDVIAADAPNNTTDITNVRMTAPNHGNQQLNDVGILINVQDISLDDSTYEEPGFKAYVIPRCQLNVNYPDGAPSNGDNPQPVTITGTASFAKKHVTGQAFTSGDFANDKTDYYILYGDNPFALTVWVADGVETTFELEYKPSTTDVTDGKTTHLFTKDAVVTAPSSLVIATAQVTISAAGSDGDIWRVLYQMTHPVSKP